MKTINFNCNINMAFIDSVITTALEGGSNYWYFLPSTNIPAPKDFKRNKEIHYEFLDKIYQGALMPVHDIENEKDVLGTLSMHTIETGLSTMQEKYPEHFANMNEDSFDADTADVFFQCCIMNEIVFG